MKKILVAITAAALLLVVFVAVRSGYRSYLGYCSETGRYLTDQDAINAVLRSELRRQMRKEVEIRQRDQKRRTHDDYIREERRLDEYVRSFVRENPNCCQIGPVSGDEYYLQPTLMNMVFGFVSKVVVVDGLGVGPSKYRVQHAVDRCGKIRWPD